ncbi:hypothetical protein Tco_0026591 [Tanacetum coccineum]
MADMNIPAIDAPAEQAPAIAPPIKTDDQILPSRNWVPIGKSNCVLDVLKPQKSLISQVVVAILKNTNFFRAFTTSSTIPSIYIQQFWDTIRYDSTTGRSVEKDGREIFAMAIPDAFLTDEIKRAPFYSEYLEHVAKYQQYLDEDHGKAKEGGVPKSPKATKHTSSQPPKSTPAPTEPSKKDQGKKRKPVKETSDAPSPAKRSKAGPACSVVINELDSGRIQPLPDVQDQFIFQMHTPMPTKPFVHAESPSLDTEQALTDSETESDEEVPGIYAGVQDEGQAGSNPGDAAERTSNFLLKIKWFLKNLQALLEPYEPEKSNTESEVQSMVTVPIQQDTSSVLPMTTLAIDLIVSHPVSTMIHAPLPTSTATVITITTTTSLLPPPPQPQQSSFDPILLQRISELEQHMADLIQSNLALEERLDKHGSKLYNLENLNIPHKVSQAVDEIEILQQRMFEEKSYEAHEDHKNLFAALQKSLERDYSNQLLADLEEARRKKRKKRATLRSPSRSSLSHPPPPPPPAGASGALGTSGASGPSQLPPPPPPPSIGTSGSAQQQGIGVSRAQELYPTDSLMHDDSIPDEQVHLSADEDSGNDHLPKADSRKDWWKPLPAKERPATPELAWTILSSNMSYVENNWASALVSTYETPAENSLLAKTRDMTTFMNWYCRQVNKTEITEVDFEG